MWTDGLQFQEVLKARKGFMIHSLQSKGHEKMQNRWCCSWHQPNEVDSQECHFMNHISVSSFKNVQSIIQGKLCSLVNHWKIWKWFFVQMASSVCSWAISIFIECIQLSVDNFSSWILQSESMAPSFWKREKEVPCFMFFLIQPILLGPARSLSVRHQSRTWHLSHSLLSACFVKQFETWQTKHLLTFTTSVNVEGFICSCDRGAKQIWCELLSLVETASLTKMLLLHPAFAIQPLLFFPWMMWIPVMASAGTEQVLIVDVRWDCCLHSFWWCHFLFPLMTNLSIILPLKSQDIHSENWEWKRQGMCKKPMSLWMLAACSPLHFSKKWEAF